jgi:ornithine decarboxylase
MSMLSLRRAVAPVRRDLPAPTPLPSVDALVLDSRPAEPLHCLRPAQLRRASGDFVRRFPGRVLYAVKCNPDPRVLRALWQGGIRHFDCASPNEVALVRQMFADAHIHYMHPVKSRAAIAEASRRYGVADFAFDSADELAKICEQAAPVRGRLGLFLRLAVNNAGSSYDLSGKFGAPADEAVELLRRARPAARRLGVTFHVGSQALDPTAYGRAIELAAKTIALAGVGVDVIDVGGGFPVAYADITPPPLSGYFREIGRARRQMGPSGDIELWAEPGRALVAAGASVVVQVQLRRGNDLYINDGIYGSLSDAGPATGLRFPVRLIRDPGAVPARDVTRYRFFGPTCDSQDRMDGPFMLPADVHEGDWIEIGQLGAYGACLRTAFNGFDRAHLVEVGDTPLL